MIRFYTTQQTASAPTGGLYTSTLTSEVLVSRNSNQYIFTKETKEDLLRNYHCLEEGVEREDSLFNNGHKKTFLSVCLKVWQYASRDEKNKFTESTTTILQKYAGGRLA